MRSRMRAAIRARNVSMESCASASRALSADGRTRALKWMRSRKAMRSASSPLKVVRVAGVAQARQQAPAFADARRDPGVAPAQPRAARRIAGAGPDGCAPRHRNAVRAVTRRNRGDLTLEQYPRIGAGGRRDDACQPPTASQASNKPASSNASRRAPAHCAQRSQQRARHADACAPQPGCVWQPRGGQARSTPPSSASAPVMGA